MQTRSGAQRSGPSTNPTIESVAPSITTPSAKHLYKDATVLVEDTISALHKSLLKKSSTYFSTMFDGPWRESPGSLDDVSLTPIPLQSLTKAEFDLFLTSSTSHSESICRR
ncbi:uncharacterized protein EV422DRAFT_570926 [Fimicolochytrium jonesii]|uniref:uncharacterized protein n=1 Tax=Fimicolochytrium jonesii TaxID=1396493 RepID=UPI0022FE203B|nr:uncharacterized protein EV422DRAFT_570926 [Fimicolochytrium jonesii]KAI8817303.1 hypothetical protein EV422DRAFT_570926 [Fimicolochytrium jonesii]